MSYRLYYFSGRGRGEQVRLMLHALEQPFEDCRLHKPEFLEMKERGALPFGSMPMLVEDDDFHLVQGPVIMGYLARRYGRCPEDPRLAARADSITLGAEDVRMRYFRLFGENAAEKQKEFVEGQWARRWLPAFERLLEQSGTGFFVGEDWTHADIAVWDALDAILVYVEGASLDGHDRLARHHAWGAELPELSQYLAERPG